MLRYGFWGLGNPELQGARGEVCGILSLQGVCTRSRGLVLRCSGHFLDLGVWGRWGCRYHRAWGCRVEGSWLQRATRRFPAWLEPIRTFTIHVSAHELRISALGRLARISIPQWTAELQ